MDQTIKKVKILLDSETSTSDQMIDEEIFLRNQNELNISANGRYAILAGVGMEVEGLYLDIDLLQKDYGLTNQEIKSIEVNLFESDKQLPLSALADGYVIEEKNNSYLFYEWELLKENAMNSRATDEQRLLFEREFGSMAKHIDKSQFIGVYDLQREEFIDSYKHEKGAIEARNYLPGKSAKEVALEIESNRIYERLVNDGEDVNEYGEQNPLLNLDNEQLLQAQGYQLRELTVEQYMSIKMENNMELSILEREELLKDQLHLVLSNNEHFLALFSNDPQFFLENTVILSGSELYSEYKVDYDQFSDRTTSFEEWAPRIAIENANNPHKYFVATNDLTSIQEIPDKITKQKLKECHLEINDLKNISDRSINDSVFSFKEETPNVRESFNRPNQIMVDKEVYETLVSNQEKLLQYTRYNQSMSLGDFTGASENPEYAIGKLEELLKKAKVSAQTQQTYQEEKNNAKESFLELSIEERLTLEEANNTVSLEDVIAQVSLYQGDNDFIDIDTSGDNNKCSIHFRNENGNLGPFSLIAEKNEYDQISLTLIEHNPTSEILNFARNAVLITDKMIERDLWDIDLTITDYIDHKGDYAKNTIDNWKEKGTLVGQTSKEKRLDQQLITNNRGNKSKEERTREKEIERDDR